MATTRAKFKCNTVTAYESSHREVKLSPVYSNDPNSENKAFWEASPNGELRLYITNPAASALFEPGKEYYIDITPAAAPVAPVAE